MRAYVEVWSKGMPELFPLERERTTVGRNAASTIAVPSDPAVSQMHAVIESYGPAFVLRDLGSSNGTFVNGRRLAAECQLRSGDEVRVGETRIVFRMQGADDLHPTVGAEGPPSLTTRERDVLISLCRPVLSGEPFAQPAGVRQLAQDLVISDAAVKFHLANLYDKFGLHDVGGSRRIRLANEAIRRRAVTIADLRGEPGE